MTRGNKNSKATLDQAINAIQTDRLEDRQIEAAGERSWEKICEATSAATFEGGNIRGCEDVIQLLPEYHAQRLAPNRALLVADHLHECVSCRLLASQASQGFKAQRPWAAITPWTQEAARAPRWSLGSYGAAAAVMLAVLSVFAAQKLYFAAPAGSRGMVQSTDGQLYRLNAGGERLVKVGEEFVEGDLMRTAYGSRAMVRLRDGSVVEMNERAELSVSATRRNTTIHLGRGDIIVQAAKQHNGHLFVATPDCKVSVTGTVFAVDSGIKGSRVSVIEGEVHVDQQSGQSILHPGDQVTSSASVGAISVRDDIAWSQHLSEHLALLAEFSKLENKLEAIRLPDLRYESRLLSVVPPESVVYASISNYGEALKEANQLFQQQLAQSETLSDWWNNGPGRNHPNLTQVVEEIHGLSQYLGKEIVLGAAAGPEKHRHGNVLLVAEVQKQGLREFLEGEIRKDGSEYESKIRLLSEDQLASTAQNTAQNNDGLFVLITPDFVAASPQIEILRGVDARWHQANSQGGFAQTPLGGQVASVYSQGVNVLVAVDLHTLTQGHGNGFHQSQAFERSGFRDVKYLIAERKDLPEQTLNTADLSFSGPRHGMAAWLAPPAPIGALTFISPHAAGVAAFAAKSPVQMFDDLMAIANSDHGTFANGKPVHRHENHGLADLESELNLNLRNDVAASLGGEVLIAMDGPLLPEPAIKFVVEVVDANRLQYSIQHLIDATNAEAQKKNEPGVRLESEQVNGRTFYEIHFLDPNHPQDVHYTYANGYLIAATTRGMLLEAIHSRESGDNITRSDKFRSLMPADRHADVSGLVYQDFAAVLEPIANQLSATQLQSLQALAVDSKPSMVCFYGGEDRITLATNSKRFGFNLNFIALSGLLHSHAKAYHGTSAGENP